jgi:hypothetical protein
MFNPESLKAKTASNNYLLDHYTVEFVILLGSPFTAGLIKMAYVLKETRNSNFPFFEYYKVPILKNFIAINSFLSSISSALITALSYAEIEYFGSLINTHQYPFTILTIPLLFLGFKKASAITK